MADAHPAHIHAGENDTRRFWEALTAVVDRNVAEVRGTDVAMLGRGT
jgi:hypothetical protein